MSYDTVIPGKVAKRVTAVREAGDSSFEILHRREIIWSQEGQGFLHLLPM